MAFKLKFWKKDEAPAEVPLGMENPIPPLEQPADMQMPGMEGPQPIPGLTEPPAPQQMQPQPFGDSARPFSEPPRALERPQPQAGMSAEQQLQLISSKLDTLKAQLDVVLQRLERLEQKDQPAQRQW